MSLQPEAPTATAALSPSLSLAGRFAAIFARPAEAWTGLERRHQWWFPLVIMTIFSVLMMVTLYQRALLPDLANQWEAQVEAGAMQPEQVDRAEAMMSGWQVRAITCVAVAASMAVFTLFYALVMSFGVGFILGGKLPFRLAFEVATWSGLVKLVELPIHFALAWSQESLKGVHLSLAALLPVADPPAKWHTMLTVFLDAVGPFNIWFVVVAVLGCSALSGAPRRNVAWVLGGLAFALAVITALLTGWLSPSA